MTARKPALLLLATAGALALGLPAQGQELPAPPPNGNVLDSAELLTDGEETELSALIDRKNSGTGAARVVVHTTDSAPGGISDYATALGDAWGVGDAGEDNGVVVVVDMGERETYIAVADGAGEQISDREAQDVAGKVLSPALADENYAAGLTDTVTELYLLADGGESAAYIKYRYANRKPPAESTEEQDEKLREEEEKTGKEYTRYAGTFNSWLPLYMVAPLLYSGSNVTPSSGSDDTGGSGFSSGSSFGGGGGFSGGGGGSSF